MFLVNASSVADAGALMDSLPQLGAIVNFGAGVDAIDVDAARARLLVDARRVEGADR